MRMFAVADSVFAVGYVYGLVRHHLDVPAVQYALLLLGYHIGYSGLAGIEVVPHLLHFVCLAVVLHFRKSGDCTRTVLGASGIHGLRLQVVFHIVCGKFHVSVCHGHIAVIVDHSLSVREIFYYGVFRSRERRPFK